MLALAGMPYVHRDHGAQAVGVEVRAGAASSHHRDRLVDSRPRNEALDQGSVGLVIRDLVVAYVAEEEYRRLRCRRTRDAVVERVVGIGDGEPGLGCREQAVLGIICVGPPGAVQGRARQIAVRTPSERLRRAAAPGDGRILVEVVVGLGVGTRPRRLPEEVWIAERLFPLRPQKLCCS